MKVKVLEKFRDKHTKEIHRRDDVMEITEERYEEILKVGKLVEQVPEEAQEEKPASKKRTNKKTDTK